MKRYLKLYSAFFRYSLIRETMFKKNFLMHLTVYFLWTFFSILMIKMFFGQTSHFGPFDEGGMTMILGTYLIVNATMSFFACLNITDLPKVITHGEFDFYITKPVNLVFLATLRRTQFLELFGFIMGIAVLIYGLLLSHFVPSLENIVPYIILILCGMVIYYSFWLMTHTLSFWFFQIENMHDLMNIVSDTSRFPLVVLGRGAKIISLTIIPVGLISNFPVLALIGQLSWYWVIYAILFTVVIFSLAVLFFNFAVRHYSSASS